MAPEPVRLPRTDFGVLRTPASDCPGADETARTQGETVAADPHRRSEEAVPSHRDGARERDEPAHLAPGDRAPPILIRTRADYWSGT